MRVYVVYYRYYDDVEILGVFSNKNDADDYKSLAGSHTYIEEWEVK